MQAGHAKHFSRLVSTICWVLLFEYFMISGEHIGKDYMFNVCRGSPWPDLCKRYGLKSVQVTFCIFCLFVLYCMKCKLFPIDYCNIFHENINKRSRCTVYIWIGLWPCVKRTRRRVGFCSSEREIFSKSLGLFNACYSGFPGIFSFEWPDEPWINLDKIPPELQASIKSNSI